MHEVEGWSGAAGWEHALLILTSYVLIFTGDRWNHIDNLDEFFERVSLVWLSTIHVSIGCGCCHGYTS